MRVNRLIVLDISTGKLLKRVAVEYFGEVAKAKGGGNSNSTTEQSLPAWLIPYARGFIETYGRQAFGGGFDPNNPSSWNATAMPGDLQLQNAPFAPEQMQAFSNMAALTGGMGYPYGGIRMGGGEAWQPTPESKPDAGGGVMIQNLPPVLQTAQAAPAQAALPPVQQTAQAPAGNAELSYWQLQYNQAQQELEAAQEAHGNAQDRGGDLAARAAAIHGAKERLWNAAARITELSGQPIDPTNSPGIPRFPEVEGYIPGVTPPPGAAPAATPTQPPPGPSPTTPSSPIDPYPPLPGSGGGGGGGAGGAGVNPLSAIGGAQGLANVGALNAATTLAGGYLHPSTNPYLGATYDAAARRMTDAYSTAVAPGLMAQAQRAGQFGSSGMEEIMALSRYDLGENLGNLGTSIYGGNYAAERDRMLSMQNMLPSAIGSIYMPQEYLAGIGAQRQGQLQSQFDTNYANAANRAEWPFNILSGFGGALGQAAGGGGTSTTRGSMSGGGMSVICTELHRQGLMDDETYLADSAFGASLPREVVDGYQFWAAPVARAMRESRILTRLVAPIALSWGQTMRAIVEGRPERETRVGRLLLRFGVPFCGWLGRKEQAWA